MDDDAYEARIVSYCNVRRVVWWIVVDGERIGCVMSDGSIELMTAPQEQRPSMGGDT